MRNVIYEGVTFIAHVCSKMSKDGFIKAHIDVFWLDKDIKTRKKMLCEVYNLIVPPTASEKEE